nr:helix-hairpin-helix domain-containing protein [Clostridia bacterium]
MHNFEIAWAFRELATLLEVKGENSFKVVAYRKGAEVLEGMDRPVAA